VVGGAGSVVGGWLAAIVLTALPEVLRGFGETNLRLLVYGVTVLFVLWFLPNGIGGLVDSGAKGLKKLISKKTQRKPRD